MFKRKGPRGTNRGLDEASDAAVQEVREMCSAQTAAVVEELVAERGRLGEELFKATMRYFYKKSAGKVARFAGAASSRTQSTR